MIGPRVIDCARQSGSPRGGLTSLAQRGPCARDHADRIAFAYRNGERLMTRPTAPRWFLPVLALPLALAACTVDPQDLSDESVDAIAASGGGVTVDVLPTVSWPVSGFLGAVRVTNTGFGSPISTYEGVFKLGGSARAGAAVNGRRTSALIKVGQRFDTGFNGPGAFPDSTIVSVQVNRTPIPIGTVP